MPVFQSLYPGEVEVHTTSVEATGNMEVTYFLHRELVSGIIY